MVEGHVPKGVWVQLPPSALDPPEFLPADFLFLIFWTCILPCSRLFEQYSILEGSMAIFPTDDWLKALMEKLNSDEKYAHIARNWEGDMLFMIEGDGMRQDTTRYYLDLWHGKCRDSFVVQAEQDVKAVFILKAPYGNFVRLLKGELEPMQALLTRKIGVQGNMAILMRNVPTVLDFVRCAREITTAYE